MKILLYIIAVVLFVNYRLIYVFVPNKTLLSFSEYLLSKETDKLTVRILTIDMIVLCLYFLNWIWLIAILTSLTLITFLWKKLQLLITRFSSKKNT